MKTVLLSNFKDALTTLLIIVTSISAGTGQIITWTGAVSSDFEDDNNWSPVDDTKLYQYVVIPTATNQPVISNAQQATIKGLWIKPGATLTINNGGTLDISDSATLPHPLQSANGVGLVNEGNIVNNGQINIDNSLTIYAVVNWSGAMFTNRGKLKAAVDFIENSGTFENDGGEIIVIRSEANGIGNSGVFVNKNNGEIDLGSDTLYERGILLEGAGTFTNESGQIHIKKAGLDGIGIVGGTSMFINKGDINIGFGSGNGVRSGISAFENFINDGGIIRIDNTRLDAIINGYGTPRSYFENKNGGQILIGDPTIAPIMVGQVGTISWGNPNGGAIFNYGNFRNLGCYSVVHVYADVPILHSPNFDISQPACFENEGILVVKSTRTSNVGVNNGKVFNVFSNPPITLTGNPAVNGINPTGYTNIWLGCESDDWSNALNWSQKTIPSANHVVLVPPSTYSPIVYSGNVQIAALGVGDASASLTINSGVNFTVDGQNLSSQPPGSAAGIVNVSIGDGTSTITNRGNLNIRNNTLTANGLWNEGKVINDGGIMTFEDISGTCIWNYEIFENKNNGQIIIGNTGHPVVSGIKNYTGSGGSFRNTSGLIEISNYTSGIFSGSQFVNSGTLKVKSGNTATSFGIYNEGPFTNDTCAEIELSEEVQNLMNGNFLNSGTMRIFTADLFTNLETFTNNGILYFFVKNEIPGIVNNDIISQPVNGTCFIQNALEIGGLNSFSIGTSWYTDVGLSTKAGDYDPASNTFYVNNTSLVNFDNYLYTTITDNVNGCVKNVPIKAKFAASSNLSVWYQDSDEDGVGNPNVSVTACTRPDDYVSNNQDCNDNNNAINPSGTEVCNGLDDNCAGGIDEGLSVTWYRDQDADGFGNPNVTLSQCAQPSGYVSNNQDCNDNNIAINPNGTEVCNGLDDNCAGGIDEGLSVTWYRDQDADGYGNPNITLSQCSQPVGYVSNNLDCNDNNIAINPSASEVCNGLDDNCTGGIDEGLSVTWYRDQDADGYGNPNVTLTQCAQPIGYVSNNQDCNDNNNAIHPNGTEVCNGIDDNCTGGIDEGLSMTWYQDQDADGFGNPNVTLSQCAQPSGYVSNNQDCNDNNNAIHPNGTEVCNGIDDNCTGGIDEGLSVTWYQDQDADGFGNPNVTLSQCAQPSGYVSNNQDCNDNNNAIHPNGTEVCNGIDDNCTGGIDEGLSVTWYQDQDADRFGNPNVTLSQCAQPIGYVSNNQDCNDNNNAIHPNGTEVCNGLDDNCAGGVDEGLSVTWYRDQDADGYGNPNVTLNQCSQPIGYVSNNQDCNDDPLMNGSNINPGEVDIPNDGIDQDCSGSDNTKLIILGSTVVCPDQTDEIYKLNGAKQGASYLWSIIGSGLSIHGGQGTSEVTIDVSNSIVNAEIIVMMTTNGNIEKDTINVISAPPVICQLSSCSDSSHLSTGVLSSATVPDMFQVDRVITSDASIFNKDFTLRAGQSIEFQPGFQILNGRELTAEIESCTTSESIIGTNARFILEKIVAYQKSHYKSKALNGCILDIDMDGHCDEDGDCIDVDGDGYGMDISGSPCGLGADCFDDNPNIPSKDQDCDGIRTEDDCNDNDLQIGKCDRDKDGIPDDEDNCPDRPNADQSDDNKNGIGNVCEPIPICGSFSCSDGDPCTVNDKWDENCQCVGEFKDSDNDSICDYYDQCEGYEDIRDWDNDGIPDACDDDASCTDCSPDEDGKIVLCWIPFKRDNMKTVVGDCKYLSKFFDTDGRLIGETICGPCQCSFIDDIDSDGDGVCDRKDECPQNANLIQMTECGCEEITQACDDDLDGIKDYEDNCPMQSNPLQEDKDGDGKGDICDEFECVTGSACDDGDECTQEDAYDDNCECRGIRKDSDLDGVCDPLDLCHGFNDHVDKNSNGIPDGCDVDESCNSCTPNEYGRISICRIFGGGNKMVNISGKCSDLDFLFDDEGSFISKNDRCGACQCDFIGDTDSDGDGKCDRQDDCPNDPNC